MNDRDSFRGPRREDREPEQPPREAISDQYKRYMEKVSERFPDLSSLGKGGR